MEIKKLTVEPGEVDPDSFCLTLTNEYGEPVGQAWGVVNRITHEATLDSIWVARNLRGQHIGTSLLQSVATEARIRGAKLLVGQVIPEYGQNVEKTYNFYCKNGATFDQDGAFCIDLEQFFHC